MPVFWPCKTSRKLEGLNEGLTVIRGAVTEPIKVKMNEAVYFADVLHGQKTGREPGQEPGQGPRQKPGQELGQKKHKKLAKNPAIQCWPWP